MNETTNEVIEKLNEFVNLMEADNFDDFKSSLYDFFDWITKDLWDHGEEKPVKKEQEEIVDLRQRDAQSFLLALENSWVTQKEEALSKVACAIKDKDRISDVISLFRDKASLVNNPKRFLIKEIELVILKLLLKEGLSDGIQKKISTEADFIFTYADSLSDYSVLAELENVYNLLGKQEERRDAYTRKEILRFTLTPIKTALALYRDSRNELNTGLTELKSKHDDLKEDYNELEEDFKRNKIRLVETLGLFAAIIAFVIAGIVGLQGLTAAGIAISITGLTAGLVILVMLINIFTSPKTYIWGKVAVLGIAFAILIAWMVVTVFCKPAIFR